MNNFKYYKMAFKKWKNFTDCSDRKEFWYFQLYNFLIILGITFLMLISQNNQFLFISFFVIKILYILIILTISFSLQVRRLHDIELSGWLLLLGIIPIIGSLILLILFVLPTKKCNKYCMDKEDYNNCLQQKKLKKEKEKYVINANKINQ